MTVKDTLTMAINNLALNRTRSGLAMIGMVMGIVGVLLMGIVGSSGTKMILNEIKTFGLQTVWVYKDTKIESTHQASSSGSGITVSDVASIQKNCVHVTAVSGVIETNKIISQTNRHELGQVLYVQPAYFGIENDVLLEGRFLLQSDTDFSRRVCVIGQDTALALFKTQKAVGKTITIDNDDFEVVGVLARKDRDILKSIGVGNGKNPNARVILPLSVILNDRDSQDVDYIQLAASSTEYSEKAAQEAIRQLSIAHHGEFNYDSVAMQQYLNAFKRITTVLSLVLTLGVIITLTVGGIGITNVMTIAVVERTKEIGIRKAIGATQRDIFYLFLAEAVVLTTLAGIIGIGLGSLVGIVGVLLFPNTFIFPLKFVYIAISVAFLTGVVSGVYPAINAAHKKPMEALRYE